MEYRRRRIHDSLNATQRWREIYYTKIDSRNEFPWPKSKVKIKINYNQFLTSFKGLFSHA